MNNYTVSTGKTCFRWSAGHSQESTISIKAKSSPAQNECRRAAIHCLLTSTTGVSSMWIARPLSGFHCWLLCRWRPSKCLLQNQCWLLECVSRWSLLWESCSACRQVVENTHCCRLLELPITSNGFVFVFPLFSLEVMSCGMPVPPINGSIVGQDFSLGSSAAYQCNPGFRLAGPVTTSVVCQESGRWSPLEVPPRCVREYLLVLSPYCNDQAAGMYFRCYNLWPSSRDLPWHWPLCGGTWKMEVDLWNPKPVWCNSDACMWPGILLQRSQGY